ncbi:MAG TPA: alkaline phosphatase family protein [Acidimicrobiia bacterium]|nr:alkaline phosphatase family protein [Acidimicrobiia bacterium]
MEPVKPDYSGPNVTNLVPALLGTRRADWLPDAVRGARSVVLLVLDGLGWEARTRHADLLPRLASLPGRAITTVVPSTTPAALTSITTGLAPSRHGVTGFRIRVDHTVLNAIRWQQENGRRPPDPAAVQRNDVFSGRRVPVVTKAEFRTSGFTGAHLRGGEFLGWQTTAVLVEHVRAAVSAGAPFVYAYYPGVDEVAHAYGLVSPFYRLELAAADRLVGEVLDALPGDTALVVTADHGQVHLEPDAWVPLGALDDLVEVYAGDARFRYLHARDGAAKELLVAAEEVVGDTGWVFARERLFDEGWMGTDPSRPAHRRVGDVVLAARAPVGFVDPTFLRETSLRSAHGSLTAAEMEVPLLADRGRALARARAS